MLTRCSAGLLQRAYQIAIIRFPWLWRLAYAQLAKRGINHSAEWFQPTLRVLEQRLEKDQPRAIVSTYPAYAGLLNALRDKGLPVPPLITVITEFHTPSIPVWTAFPQPMRFASPMKEHPRHGRTARPSGAPDQDHRFSGQPGLHRTGGAQPRSAGDSLPALYTTPACCRDLAGPEAAAARRGEACPPGRQAWPQAVVSSHPPVHGRSSASANRNHRLDQPHPGICCERMTS